MSTSTKQNLYISKIHDRVAIEFAPVSVTEARKRPGERKQLENILKILKRSHQNFFVTVYDIKLSQNKRWTG